MITQTHLGVTEGFQNLILKIFEVSLNSLHNNNGAFGGPMARGTWA